MRRSPSILRSSAGRGGALAPSLYLSGSLEINPLAQIRLPKIYSGDPEPLACSVAALRLAIDPNESLDTVVVGHASLTSWVQKFAVRSEVESASGELVRTVWQRRIAFPAQFSSPPD